LKNYFELFGLVPAFALDLALLDRAYRDIQTRIHPDRFAQAGDAERRASMQMSAQVNEAYRTLKSPVRRASYLLELNGVDTGFETNTAMPPEFLMKQMELRERLEETRDAASLAVIEKEVLSEKQNIGTQIAECIDARRDYESAKGLVRKLMFLEKFGAEIDAVHEALEA
jgi:molecular chaperone HscB